MQSKSLTRKINKIRERERATKHFGFESENIEAFTHTYMYA